MGLVSGCDLAATQTSNHSFYHNPSARRQTRRRTRGRELRSLGYEPYNVRLPSLASRTVSYGSADLGGRIGLVCDSVRRLPCLTPSRSVLRTNPCTIRLPSCGLPVCSKPAGASASPLDCDGPLGRSCETYDVLLRELAVENFRPFGATSVRVPSSGLVLVAGAINAGKSALLSALDVVAGIGSDTTAWRRAGSSEPARISATFDLSAEDKLALSPTGLHEVGSVDLSRVNQLKLVFEEQAGSHPLLAHVLASWQDGEFLQLMTTGPREGDPGIYGVKVMRGLLAAKDDVDPRLLVERGDGGWVGPVLLETASGQ